MSNKRKGPGKDKRRPIQRLPNISFHPVDGESLPYVLDSKIIAVSTGATCASGSADVSHVLTAMGLSPALAVGCRWF